MKRQTTILPPSSYAPVPTLGWEDLYILPTQDGSDTVFSRAHQATYHSMYGAVSESKHVFLQQGLEPLAGQPVISILEFGFGTGLNAFLAFLFSIKHDHQVHYTGIESNPLAPAIARKLNYPEYLAFPEERDIFIRMHEETRFTSTTFRFEKCSRLEDVLPASPFHCIFFDAFAPEVQPELWEQGVFEQLFQLLFPSGTIVTYCAKGDVRRRMQAAGFAVTRIAGPPGKREMIKGIKA